MAQGEAIRSKIKSAQGTQTITRAMQMVAAAKMPKAQEHMQAVRPYADCILAVMSHFRAAHPEYRHPYFAVRPVRRAGLLVVTSDRGLAGALNANVLRAAAGCLRAWQEQGIEADIGVYGNKAAAFFRRLQAPVVAQAAPLGDRPPLSAILGVVKVMLDAYREGRIDRLVVVFNHFQNTMTQHPVVDNVLPLPEPKDQELAHWWDYLYEPDAHAVIDTVFDRYIETRIHRAILENQASEQAARMVAMRAATDNAGRLIGDLRLAYNKARQAAITQELAEIVSGASAV